MQRFRSLRLFLCALIAISGLSLLPFACADQGNASVDFWVRGNREMCKKTIETALNAQVGVSSATYDVEAHTAHVRYDSTRITPAALHKACAAVGYETKVEAASVSAYDALPKCCKKVEDM